MKVWRCDKCGKEIEILWDSYVMKQKTYPDNWCLARVFTKSIKAGGASETFHFCGKCRAEIFTKS